MVYPIDKKGSYEKKRDRWCRPLVGFGIGSLSNLLPFMDLSNNIHLAFLSIDLSVLLISAATYIYYQLKIVRLGKNIIRSGGG